MDITFQKSLKKTAKTLTNKQALPSYLPLKNINNIQNNKKKRPHALKMHHNNQKILN
ncbi:hypothetical protein MHY_15610 [Megamonas hypermegale ART12/1]|nr:hypothetical protein MHY_15610 [Megamonas hypermegale ART12/1]